MLENFCDSICENYRCELDKGHEGLHKCGTIIWDENGIVKPITIFFNKYDLPSTKDLHKLYRKYPIERLADMFKTTKWAIAKRLKENDNV